MANPCVILNYLLQRLRLSSRNRAGFGSRAPFSRLAAGEATHLSKLLCRRRRRQGKTMPFADAKRKPESNETLGASAMQGSKTVSGCSGSSAAMPLPRMQAGVRRNSRMERVNGFLF